MPARIKNTIYYCLGILLVALIFQLISISINNNVVVPSLHIIIKDFIHLLGEGKTYIYLWNTIKDLLISLVIAIAFGIALGTLAGLNDSFYRLLKPFMSLFRILPVIVLILIIMLFISFDYVPLIVSTLILFPMIFEGTYQGIIKIDRNLINAYRMDSAFNIRILFKIYLPLITPSLKTALINALGLGIKIIVTAEYICGSKNTLGKAIISCLANLEYSYLYGYSIILIILILLIELLPNIINKIVILIKNLINRRINA